MESFSVKSLQKGIKEKSKQLKDWALGKKEEEGKDMVSILIVTDEGNAYCMAESLDGFAQCMAKVTDEKIQFIPQTEKRLAYLSRALAVIEGEAEDE